MAFHISVHITLFCDSRTSVFLNKEYRDFNVCGSNLENNPTKICFGHGFPLTKCPWFIRYVKYVEATKIVLFFMIRISGVIVSALSSSGVVYRQTPDSYQLRSAHYPPLQRMNHVR
jgi:hypothetical protein